MEVADDDVEDVDHGVASALAEHVDEGDQSRFSAITLSGLPDTLLGLTQ